MSTIKSANVSTDNILEIFKKEFASTVIPVFIPSVKKTINFREVSIQEQKVISKTMIENRTKPGTIYNTITNLLQTLCVSKNVNVADFTEAERYSILFSIYQSAFLDKPQHFICSGCGEEFNASLRSEDIINNFENLNSVDKVFEISDKVRNFTFVCNYPSMSKMNAVMEYIQRKTTGQKFENDDQQANSITAVINSIDYLYGYIKSIKISKENSDSSPIEVSTSDYKIDDVMACISMIPQHIMLANDVGLISKIITELVKPINDVYAKQKCPNCGTEFEGQIGSIRDFFTYS